jgi:putative flavoprotein involved in K+ transport
VSELVRGIAVTSNWSQRSSVLTIISVSLVVIGGGQAGLAVSGQLVSLGVEHVVLERDRVAETWRRRWDSFHLVTPNWTLSLPGAPYDGDDPEGFVARDQIVAYLERYAAGLPCAPAWR